MLLRILALFALLLLSAAYLSYEHLRPWVTFNSEMLATLAAIVAMAALVVVKAKLPLRILVLWSIAAIPLLQYALGLIFFQGTAILQFSYLALFVCMVMVGYNLSLQPAQRQEFMQAWCWMLLLTGLASSAIALMQWLQLEQHFFYMMGLSNSRPYANFAQPNNFCTFAIMALLANLYLTDRKAQPKWLGLLFALILLFAIGLTQSRTAWITLPFICVYWGLKTAQFKRLGSQSAHEQLTTGLKQRYLWAGLLVFIIIVALLPSVNVWLNQQLGIEAIKTASAAARAGGGHERLTMWQQMFAALQMQPWTGYGWGQVAVAQAQVLTEIPLKIWFNSSHNVLIDLLVVNGVIIGAVVIGFFTWWLWQLNKHGRSPEAVIALLMVAAILIHAMLEYPQRYAYFLLPMGLLLGVVQAEQAHLKFVRLPRSIAAVIVIVALGVWGGIWRDYSLGINNIKAARLIENERLQQNVPQYDRVQVFVPKHQLYLLDQFARTAYWVSLNPFNRVDALEIERYRQVVVLAPSRKNLYKFAQLLAYNGQHDQARQQLKILYTLYGVQVDQAQLLERDAF